MRTHLSSIVAPASAATVAALQASVLSLTPLVPIVTTESPTTGQALAFPEDDKDRVLDLTPAGTLATLTVALPANSTSRIGQICRVVTSQAITVLTVNGATTIRGNVTALGMGHYVSFQKVAANTWARIA